jgi:hypothetical protein
MRLAKVVLSVCFAIAVAAPALAADAFILIPGVPGDSTRVNRQGWSEVEAESLFVAPAMAEKGKTTVVSCSTTVQGFLGAGASKAIPLVGAPLSGNVVIEIEAFSPEGVSQVVSRAVLGGAVIESIARSFPALSHELKIRFSTIELTTWKQTPTGALGAPQVGSFDCTRP